MSEPTKACENCRKEVPFGLFHLVKKSSGAPKNAIWSVRFNCYVQILERYLCAQCGFNITSLRVVKHYEVPERVETPSGATSIRVRDVIAPDRPFLQCTLITKIEATYEVALEADRQRYWEQVQALAEQRKARRLSMFEKRLRAIGSTVRDQMQGIKPLTEDEILEALEKYMSGGAMRAGGVSTRSVPEAVPNIVTPRGAKVSTQRVSSTSPIIGAAPALPPMTVTPRRARP